uniref:Uncharacterized protein n=1 Tax=Anguilla anguilla TaxID=7936 RepID=A0A0E9SHB4_ANGAN
MPKLKLRLITACCIVPAISER